MVDAPISKMVVSTMALSYDNDSKRYGDGIAGDVRVTPMVVNAGSTDDNLAKSLPSSSPHTRAHTHAHARASQHPGHTYPTGSHHVISSSGFGYAPMLDRSAAQAA